VSSWRQAWRAHRDQVETVVVSLALGFGLVTVFGVENGFARVGIGLALTAGLLALLAAIGWVSGRLRR
jgi:hypothetical protein